MARPGRPASESYQPASCSVSQSASYSSEARLVGREDREDAPIFSLSKSSMDVVMATGPPHKRDPAFTRMDLRRSSSTNTHSEQNSVTLQQLHPRMCQHINSTNNQQLSLTAQHVDGHSPPALSERWITNMHRWSGSTHSRSSTPDTIVWKGGTSRPSSVTQETPCSPLSKATSPPDTPSPFISPLQTPTSSSSTLTLSTHQQEELLASSPTPTQLPSPLPSPLQAHTSSPLPSNSPDLSQPALTEDEGFLDNSLQSFQFPSPIPPSVSLAEGGVSSDPGCLLDDLMKELHSSASTQLSEGGGLRSPVQMPNSPAVGQKSRREASVYHLEPSWQPGQSCQTGRGWRTPLASSLSDSLLGDCCRCNLSNTKVFREEGTMTSQLELVDAVVQTISPIGSLWGLKRTISNTGSHSFLGSPPGSRLNLKSSVGSNSNLVSPSSSMFPVSSEVEEEEEEEEDEEEEESRGATPTLDISSTSLHDLEKRRSCLKNQTRRSSMKQVQWDEDGMTWDVHGASVDPKVLTTAIQKHMEIQNSPRLQRHSSKKKKAPKPPLISNVVKAMTPELHPPVMIKSSTCTVEDTSEATPETDGGGRDEEEPEKGGKREVKVKIARRLSRAEGAYIKEDDEVYGEDGTSRSKSPSHGSGHSRKKGAIRSLRRPGWCGGSRNAED